MMDARSVLILRTLPTHQLFLYSSRRPHTRCLSDWSSEVCSSDLHFLKCAQATVKERSLLAFALLRLIQLQYVFRAQRLGRRRCHPARPTGRRLISPEFVWRVAWPHCLTIKPSKRLFVR